MHALADSVRSKNYLYFLFGVCFIGSVFGGITATLMSSYLPVVMHDLLPNAAPEKIDEVSAIINSVYLFGMMAGGLLLGFLGDRYGRKTAVQLSIISIGLFTLFTSFASGWIMVSVLRFLAGVGVGGVLVSTTILLAEEWPSKTRNVMLGILSTTIPVGIFSAGLITYNVANWRTGFLIGLVTLVMAGISHFLLQESEKWKNQSKGAVKEKTISIFHSSILYDLLIGCIIYGTMLIGLWAIFSWLPTWVQSLVADSGQQERGLSMMLFAVGGLLGGFSSGWITNALGIKKTMILCFTAVFVLSFTLFKLTPAISLLSYLQMAGIAIFFGMSQGALNVYIPELFPVSVRSSATGFCFNIGRTFTAAAVFFVGWLVQSLGGYGNALFIFSFIFLVGLVATFLANEKDLIETEHGLH